MSELEPDSPVPITRSGVRDRTADRMSDPEAIDTQPLVHTDAGYAITDETGQRLAESISENTERAYEHAWKKFCDWCIAQRRNPLPATAQTLTAYVRHLINLGRAPNTIDQAMGAIRSKHSQDGYDNTPPTTPARGLYKEYRREWAKQGNQVRRSAAIGLDTLRAMVATCDPDTLQGLRDRALLLLGYQLTAGRSELSRLDINDVQDVPDGSLNVFIQSSNRGHPQGDAVHVPYEEPAEMCAVRAVRAWREALAERRITDGPLFRPIDRYGRLGHEANAAGHTATRLTGKSVSGIVKRRAQIAGLSERYTARGLR
jgi:site-specific recombinase XerD